MAAGGNGIVNLSRLRAAQIFVEASTPHESADTPESSAGHGNKKHQANQAP